VTYVLRRAAPADLPAIHALSRRIEIGDHIPMVTPLEEFMDWNDDPNFSFADDSRVTEIDGELVAYGNVWYRPSDSSQSRAFVMGGVDPAYRRRGIGSELFNWQLKRARQRVLSGPDHLPRFIRTMAFDFETEAIALYERHGLGPVRYYDELLRPIDEVESVQTIPEIEMVPWDAGRSAELRIVHNMAFADHWGSTPLDPVAWAHRLESHGTRTDISWMAVDRDRIVALALNGHYPSDQELTGRLDGWVMGLGTDPDYRKRGIASALVLRSCQTFVSAGFTHAALGVDSENPNGAYRLYERLGFRPMHRSVQHQIEV
jgi:mycothiol synthase